MNLRNSKYLLASDFDGTISNLKGEINPESIKLLKNTQNNVVKAVITGRSIFTARRVMDANFPIDYLVFSTGAGIINWQTGEIILEKYLSREQAGKISSLLIEDNYDFFIHKEIPENHEGYYYKNNNNNDNHDFNDRVNFFQERYEQFSNFSDIPGHKFTQFVVIVSESPSYNLLDKFQKIFGADFSVIMTTSPWNHTSAWLEIFPKDTDKGKALNYLSDILKIEKENIMAVGNDHNDYAMLKEANFSYLVDTAKMTFNDIKHLKIVNNEKNQGFILACTDFLKRIDNYEKT